MNGEGNHASLVASAAASNHPIYRGMAPGATVMSAGIQGPARQDDIDALVWAFDQGAEVVNASYGWCPGSTQIDDIDRAFDHYARARFRLLAVAAGNNIPACPFDYVDSPVKGWNVLSVGAYDDHKEDTLLDWLRDAAEHAEAMEEPLLARYRIQRGQLNNLWAYVGHQGEKKATQRPPKVGHAGALP